MTDTYRSFRELASSEREGEDWTREYVQRGSRILVMAPHGGWIEPFTAELARAMAGNDLSYYAFQGLKDRGNPRLHLTSHRFDEPLALEAVSSALWVVAVHGEKSSHDSFVMVGGLWEEFRRRMTNALAGAGIRVQQPRYGLGGVNPKNICNRGGAGIGGQLEISEGLRKTLREDPIEFQRFVELVRGVLADAEASGIRERGAGMSTGASGAMRGADDLLRKAQWADEALRELADPERRRVTQGYFPTAMEILGVSAPKMRTVLRQLLREAKGESPERILELVGQLRELGTHEGRQVSFELLEKRPDARDLLKTRDVRRLGEGNDNWASVDAFCVFVAGPLWREGRISDKEVLSWSRSRDLWWRRTALVSTVPLNMKSRGGSGDPRRTIMVCDELAADREPMVAKGLSWALRALIPVDRRGVEEFLKRHDDVLPALVKREVNNKLETGKKNPNR
jgi:phage replication-related protein YjqB (UPF0714/DUF867 family)/3-methyladenine DNA glycosylase AlkD